MRGLGVGGGGEATNGVSTVLQALLVFARDAHAFIVSLWKPCGRVCVRCVFYFILLAGFAHVHNGRVCVRRVFFLMY